MATKEYVRIGSELRDNFIGIGNVEEVLYDGSLKEYLAEFKGRKGIIILADTEDVFPGCKKDVHLPNGIRMAQLLRLEGINAPILFTSWASRRELYSGKPDRAILNAVGHDFVQQPVSAADLIALFEGMKELDKLELTDVQNACCSREGITEDILHDLKDALKRCPCDEEKKRLLITAIGKMAGIYRQSGSEAIAAFEQAYPVINARNLETAQLGVEAYRGQLIRENPPDHAVEDDLNDRHKPVEKRNWKIIWIDDAATDDDPLKKMLKARGVDVIIEQDARKAREILERDRSGKIGIAIVLADYRLYENKDGVPVQQPLQGYSLLNEISMEGRMIRLAALSALPRKFLLGSFRYFKIRTEVYSKDDYLRDERSMRMLCDELMETGDELQEAIASMPDTKGWQKHLKAAYVDYRNHPEYVAMERSISNEATRLVDAYHAGQFSGIPGFIKATFKYNPSDSRKNITKLRPYLLARRLALWFSRRALTAAPATITALLTGAALPEGPVRNSGKGAGNWPRFMISQVLGLRLHDFPLGLTIEEQRWFDYDLRSPTYSDICRMVLHRMEQFYKEELGKHASFFAGIKRNGYTCKFIEKAGDEKFGKEMVMQGMEKRRKALREEVIIFNEDGLPSLKTFYHAMLLYNEFRTRLDPFDPNLSGYEKEANKEKAQAFSRSLKGSLGSWMARRDVRDLMPNGKVPELIETIMSKLERDGGGYPDEKFKWLTPQIRDLIDRLYQAVKDRRRVSPKPGKETEYYDEVYLAYHNAEEMLAGPKQKVTLHMVIEGIDRQKKLLAGNWFLPNRMGWDGFMDKPGPEDEDPTYDGAEKEDEDQYGNNDGNRSMNDEDE